MSWRAWVPGEYSRYQKKVQEFDAFRFGRENEPGWFEDEVKAGRIIDDRWKTGKLLVRTATGDANVWNGDWICKDGAKGYLTVIHHDTFLEHYEPVHVAPVTSTQPATPSSPTEAEG